MTAPSPILTNVEAAHWLRLDEGDRATEDAVTSLHRLVRDEGLRPLKGVTPYRFHLSELEQFARRQTDAFVPISRPEVAKKAKQRAAADTQTAGNGRSRGTKADSAHDCNPRCTTVGEVAAAPGRRRAAAASRQTPENPVCGLPDLGVESDVPMSRKSAQGILGGAA